MKTNILNNMVNTVRVWAIMMVCLIVFGVGNAWGDETLTITGSIIGGSSGYSSSSATATTDNDSDVDVEWTDALENSTPLQLKASTGVFLSTSCPSGFKIKSIKITSVTNTMNLYCSSDGSSWSSSLSYTDGTALDVASSNYKYFKVTATASYTKANSIVVVYTATTPKTVTFNKQGGTFDDPSVFINTNQIKEQSAGAGITLPLVNPSSACASEGWGFYGWATAAVASSTTTAPTIVGKAGDTYYPASDITLHAVFAQGEYTKETSAITAGGKYLIVANSGGDNYVMTNNYSKSGDYGQLAGEQIDETTTNKYSAASVNAAYVFTIVTASSLSVGTGDWMIKNEADNKFVSVDYEELYLALASMSEGSDGNYIRVTSGTWKITNYYSSEAFKLYYNSSENVFLKDNDNASSLLLYKAGTINYWSTPSCCDKIVELSAGTKTNVSSITFSSDEVATCSSTATSRQVTVIVTPSTGYLFKSGDELTWTKSSGTIPAAPTLVSGPTLNAGKYEFVYRFAQDDNGAGTFAATASTYTNYLTRCGYLITYDCNSETSGCPTDVERAFRLPSPLPSAPTKTGYSFAGWYTDASFSSAAVAGATLSDNITLYAKWTQSVKLHDNNGDSHSGSTTATFNASGPLSVTAPTRTGYSVEGYYAEVGCTNKVMTDEGALVNYSGYVESSKWIHSGATTLYTKWSPNTNTAYTVKHYQQKLDGTYPSTPTETENLTGTTAASVTPAVKSYTGFTDPSTQTVTILADGSRVVEYKYTRNSYTLAWALDGGSISSAGTAAGSVKYGAPLTAPTVTKTGYTFSSWSPSVPATMPAANSTYTAQWSANTITITWNANGAGATVSPTSSSYTYDGATVSLPTPTRSLYAFDGWYTDASGGTQITEVGTTNKPTADVTYYAHWRALTFEIKDQVGTGTADIHLTSTNGVTVNATSACGNLITIKANNLDAISNLGGGTANKQNIQIKYLDANNGDAEVAKASSPFRLCYNGSPNYNVADGSNINLNGLTEYSQTYSISYTPSAYGVEDHYKLQLRLQNNNTEAITITFDLYGRALPEEFVIAAKKGDQWYALPNSILDNNRAITPLKITVNDPSTPTAATYAPSEAVYKGTSRYASGTNVYGIRLTDPDGHWLQVSSSSGTNYVWVSGTGSTTCQDWKLSSSDFNRYTLTIPSSGAGDKKFGINNLGNIGYFASDATGLCADVYLLPITNKYTEIPATVHEWGVHGVVVQPSTPATLSSVTSATMNVDTDDPTTATATAVNAAMGTAKYVRVYAAGVTVGGVANEGKQLYVHWKNSGGTEIGVSQVTIPCVIAEDATMSSIANTKAAWAAKSEVHILPGVTLDANAGSFAGSGPLSVSQMEIYPGATLKVSTGTFNATTLRLRCGWTRAGDKEYDVARVYINATNDAALTKTTASMDYDIYEMSEGRHYYPLAVPFETAVSGIDYADTYLAGYSNYGLDGQYVIKTYNGKNRADNGPSDDNWVVVGSDKKLQPGRGYIMTAVPVKGEAIIRVPLAFDNAWTADGEKGSATVDAKAVEKDTVSVGGYTASEARHAGWNILGVPYMSCFASGSASHSGGDDAFITGKMELTGDPADPYGGYDDGVVYVTVPTHNFSEYLQYDITDDDTKLLPGWCFFVQFAEDGILTFAAAGQQDNSSLPIYAPQRTASEEPVVRTGIILSGAETSDKTTLLISNKYSAEYEIGADLEKMFGNGYTLATYSLSRDTRLAYNAMSREDAKKVIPIGFRAPEDGEYTFSLNPRYAEAAVERVDLIDYQTGEVTNLMMSDYTFTTVRTQDDERFALNVVPIAKVPTGVDGVNADGERARKIILDDKMFIIYDDLLYDATGKRVVEINK